MKRASAFFRFVLFWLTMDIIGFSLITIGYLLGADMETQLTALIMINLMYALLMIYHTEKYGTNY